MAKKTLHPALAFMNQRVKELHAQGKPMKAAMRQAGREWQARKRSGTAGGKTADTHVTRKRNPPSAQSIARGISLAPGYSETSGGKFELGDQVHVRKRGREAIVAGAKRGPESSGFLGLWKRQERPTYALSTAGGYLRAKEDELQASNPMRFVTPWTLAVAGLIVWGMLARRQSAPAV